MARNKSSMQYTMLKSALEGVKNNNTTKSYKKLIKRFCIWAKEEGYNNIDQVDVACIQKFELWLENSPKQYAPSTIHKYLAPICKAVNISMSEIRKLKRTSFCIIRGRSLSSTGVPLNQNKRGKAQESDPHYARLVEFQRKVGIRRAELSRLTGSDCIRKGNDIFVRVTKGKGGKNQMQYILPQDQETVLRIFEGVKSDEHVFSKTEMNCLINLHGLRRERARECYEYYKSQINNPAFAANLRHILLARWEEGHEQLKQQNFKKWQSQKERFIHEMRADPWCLRGENKIKARNTGRPTEYNRLCLLAVSVLHLSHYRISVAVNNYIL